MEIVKNSKNLGETAQIADWFVSILKNKKQNKSTIIFLSGELGAGKTEFIRSVAKILKTKERVQSPTFVIMRNLNTEDKIFNKITHIDAYRLNKKEDLEQLGFGELAKDKNRLILIEWSKNVPNLIQAGGEIEIKIIGENKREFNFNLK